jgi:hypothetical protein
MITAVSSAVTILLPLFLCRWSYSALAFTNSFSKRPPYLPSISNSGWSQRCTPSSMLSPVVVFSAGCYPSSTSSDNSNGSITSSVAETSSSSSSTSLDEREKDETTPRVWSEWQEWALQDNVPKFLITIPQPQSTVVDPPQKFILWRNMVRDVPEFNGYTAPLVRSMYVKRRRKVDSEDADVPPILPLIEQFTFEPNRGMSGIVYGFQGIADGTRITTPPLYDLHQTIQLGYVYTREEGKSGPVLAYEIGSPSQHQNEEGDSWLDILRRRRQTQILLPIISSSSSLGGTPLQEGTMLFREENGPNNLGSLVSISAIVLGTATAANILSHHLTVNIFWV